VVEKPRDAIQFARIDVRDLTDDVKPIERLDERIRATFPNIDREMIALIDSPRWPRDLDCSCVDVRYRVEQVRRRAIDEALGWIVQDLRLGGSNRFRLSMFPTPGLEYFLAQIGSPICKPHLRAFGYALFGSDHGDQDPIRGGNFTRFMLIGFALYRALQGMGVTCYESYPDLQFRLSSHGEQLPSKIKGAPRSAALASRRKIVMEFASRLGISGGEEISSLDAADAAIIALAACRISDEDVGIFLTHPAEGTFLFALDRTQAQLLSLRDD
jgi:hypothetical protein